MKTNQYKQLVEYKSVGYVIICVIVNKKYSTGNNFVFSNLTEKKKLNPVQMLWKLIPLQSSELRNLRNFLLHFFLLLAPLGR